MDTDQRGSQLCTTTILNFNDCCTLHTILAHFGTGFQRLDGDDRQEPSRQVPTDVSSCDISYPSFGLTLPYAPPIIAFWGAPDLGHVSRFRQDVPVQTREEIRLTTLASCAG
jgi:hypothetical protein